ncbi:DUF4158 domain-containing protein [Paraburkholderia xenovorans]
MSTEDFAFVRQHRGGHNRLGIAVLMVYLRYPGRVLGPAEKPHAPIIGIVAAQLGVTPAVWDVYAARDETRREHKQELPARLGLLQFGRQHYRALLELLLPVAMHTTQGIVLAQTAVDDLRRQHVLLPPVPALQKLCAAVTTRAQREVHRLLTAPLADEQRLALDQLLFLSPIAPSASLRGYGNRRASQARKRFSHTSSACRQSDRSARGYWPHDPSEPPAASGAKAGKLLSTSSKNMKQIGVTPRSSRSCSTPQRR